MSGMIPPTGLMNIISNGAESCLADKNCRSAEADGLLPTLYGRFGWKVDESYDYDPLYRDDGDTSTDAELNKKHQARTQV
jgi:hypothetical protein